MTDQYDFRPEVSEAIGFYVYRLVDPRNGVTFYVGKGKGARIIQHLKLNRTEFDHDDEANPKFDRISSIRADGFQPTPIIHRHGMNEETALEVEAALIDMFDDLTNKIRGHGSSQYGPMHLKSVIEKYQSETVSPSENCLIVSVQNTVNLRDNVGDAARYCWGVNLGRAQSAELVLAVKDGIIVGVFNPTNWRPVSHEAFPNFYTEGDKGYGFDAADVSSNSPYYRKRPPVYPGQKGFTYWEPKARNSR